MRRSFSLLAIVSVAVVLAGASPAQALTKERLPLALATEPFVAEGFCPFPVTQQDLKGSGTITLVSDAEGNLVRIDIHPHGVVTRLSANGKSVTFNNSGPVTVFPQPDGTDLVVLRGNSFEADQGLITGEAFFAISSGRVVIVSRFNPETGFNDFISFSSSQATKDVCKLLARN